jgi:gamma-glutamyltranspeptidase/glutathione hydrolase
VPGSLKSWCHIEEKYGKLGLEAAIQPAIRYAEEGFPSSQYLVDIIADCRGVLWRFPASREVFLPGGAPPKAGQLIVQKDYAHTLGLIARHGSDALYNGEIGSMVASDMEVSGGIITRDDLMDYRIKEREPVRGTYRGYEIASVGPTSAGGVCIIQMLNLLEEFDVAGLGYGTAESLHLIAEAMKIAFADRFKYMGDPDFVDVPINSLISKEYALLRRQEIDMARAGDYHAGKLQAYSGESKNTTHLTVADEAGNVVAMTQTIHEAFGSKVVIPGTGMLLNNTMYIFDPHPGHANSIAPGKRMLSSMSPTIVMKEGRPFMALGTPGGTRIFGSVLQAIANVIDHGMALQEAVEAPRVWTQGGALSVEEGIAPAVREELAAMGHRIEVVPKVAGGMNGVMFDRESGLIHGAACWRADGSPAGISGGSARPGLLDAVYRI